MIPISFADSRSFLKAVCCKTNADPDQTRHEQADLDLHWSQMAKFWFPCTSPHMYLFNSCYLSLLLLKVDYCERKGCTSQ